MWLCIITHGTNFVYVESYDLHKVQIWSTVKAWTGCGLDWDYSPEAPMDWTGGLKSFLTPVRIPNINGIRYVSHITFTCT